VTLTAPATRTGPRSRAPRPERWLWGIALVGWGALLVLTVLGGHHASGSLGPHALGWTAMVAVMAPLVAPNVRYAMTRSAARARSTVGIGVGTGWAVVWLAAAAVLGVGTWALATWIGGVVTLAVLTVLAAAWQATPVKRRSLARCDRRLAPPLDRRRAGRAARRFGVVLGRDCVLSCWPLMGLMAAAGHAVPVAAACVGVAWYERRRRPHHDPGTRETAFVIAAIGATALVATVLF
jgi:predicted metal-binding membrane protein